MDITGFLLKAHQGDRILRVGNEECGQILRAVRHQG